MKKKEIIQILPKELQPFVLKLVEKVKMYNLCYETEDYLLEACKVYLEKKEEYIKGRMKSSTFFYWHIQTALYQMADTGEITFDIFKDDTYMYSLDNKEFRKQKKTLEKKGYTWKSRLLRESLYFDEDGEERRKEIGTETFDECINE